jgi:hypothetical protein
MKLRAYVLLLIHVYVIAAWSYMMYWVPEWFVLSQGAFFIPFSIWCIRYQYKFIRAENVRRKLKIDV